VGSGGAARLRQLTAKARRRGAAEEGNGCGGVARLLEASRWRTGDREAREVMEARRSSGLGLGLTSVVADGKRRRKKEIGMNG
jgi:hypothetical protein